jgi:hypothetical protein
VDELRPNSGKIAAATPYFGSTSPHSHIDFTQEKLSSVLSTAIFQIALLLLVGNDRPGL